MTWACSPSRFPWKCRIRDNAGDGNRNGRRYEDRFPLLLRRRQLREDHRIIVFVTMTTVAEDKIAEQKEEKDEVPAPQFPQCGRTPLRGAAKPIV